MSEAPISSPQDFDMAFPNLNSSLVSLSDAPCHSPADTLVSSAGVEVTVGPLLLPPPLNDQECVAVVRGGGGGGGPTLIMTLSSPLLPPSQQLLILPLFISQVEEEIPCVFLHCSSAG